MAATSVKHYHVVLCLLGSLLIAFTQCSVPASEFQLEGDYLIGGLFDVHYISTPVYHDLPEAMDCSRQRFLLSSYQRFQLMRFAVEEINNSTSLLPNVSLGYEIFDHCSATQNFPDIFRLISYNGSIQPWAEQPKQLQQTSSKFKVISVVGPCRSSHALTIAPLFMADLVPVISYGATISVLSEIAYYPSFLRTVHPNKIIIDVIVHILNFFHWHWIAFLKSEDDFGNDGLELFINSIKGTEICLAYTKSFNSNTNYSQVFRQIEAQKINIVIVFAPRLTAEPLIESALQLNITNKVWIGPDGWPMSKTLRQMEAIKNIGTVLGVTQTLIPIPGFSEFIYSSKRKTQCENAGQQTLCNQIFNCSGLNPKDILEVDSLYSFSIYSAVYSVAYALHNTLQCGADRCYDNITVYPYMVFAELKKSSFTLLNQVIQFNENGDPKFGSYSIVCWNRSGEPEVVGFYTPYPTLNFFINTSKIVWHTKNKQAPISVCSDKCSQGFVKQQIGIKQCCFLCSSCPSGTYINSTEDPYTCIKCKDTEWSEEGSTSCKLREVEYIMFTDIGAVVLMVGVCAFMVLTLAISVLFAINYNTPVVKSAGGPMCFLILGCLSLCSLGVFFYFGKPTVLSCILRLLPFILFYTVCLACFVVRSFQIVCIFKIAAKFPQLHSWWMKYNGQWLVITGAFIIQVLLLLTGYSSGLPKPFSQMLWYQDKIILDCDINLKATAGPVVLLAFMCSLCFIFSYIGKELPKNYNEAKAITFCLLLLILTWIVFATVYMLYHDKLIITLNALALLSSLYSFLLWYFLPKCYIIIFQPHKNTPHYFQGLIQNYTKTISQ